MKIGDLVELTFLDHVEIRDTDTSLPPKHSPLKMTVRGPVINLSKQEGHRFVEVATWEGQGENSNTAIVLLSCVISIRKLTQEKSQ